MEQGSNDAIRQKLAIERGISFSEIRLFLEKHSLEVHKIWHQNTLVNFQRGIIKVVSVKLLLKYYYYSSMTLWASSHACCMQIVKKI